MAYLLLIFMTALPALAAPTNTSGPWGIDAAGFKNLSTALASPITVGKTVVISKPMAINNKTVNGNRNVNVIAGGRIDPAIGKTVTFGLDSSLDIGDHQGFGGAGQIKGLKKSQAEWFGGKGDGATDDYSALQKAIDAGANLVLVAGRNYIHLVGLAIDINKCGISLGRSFSIASFFLGHG